MKMEIFGNGKNKLSNKNFKRVLNPATSVNHSNLKNSFSYIQLNKHKLNSYFWL
jgi:hypothetical protein